MAEYFDFLENYGKSIDKKLKIQPSATELIHKARCAGLTEPTDTLHWCRIVGEAMVNSYDGGSGDKMALRLFSLREKNEISPQQGQGLKSIWTIGSEFGSHAGRRIDAKTLARKTLETVKLLDSCLRYFIKDKIEVPYEIVHPNSGDPFINSLRDETDTAIQAVASDSSAMSKHAAEIKEMSAHLTANNAKDEAISKDTSKLLSEIEEIESTISKASVDKSQDVALIAKLADAIGSGEPLSEQDRQMFAEASARFVEVVNLEKQAETLKDAAAAALLARQDMQDEYETIKVRADEILAEFDWIARMLNGKGRATKKQLEAINRSDTILRIRGGAGTGKSLVLLTKCLRELDKEAFSSMQERLDLRQKDTEKTALLVTYNKSLKKYLSDILERLSNSESVSDTIKRAIRNITIVNYDSFLNTVLRPFSDAYSRSGVIYQKGNRGDWGTLDYVREVLGEDASVNAVYFYDEEFAWIASLGDMSLDRYLAIDRQNNRDFAELDLRKGSDDRKVVFARYEEFKTALHQDGRYLVSDITLDLLKTPEKLPKFDVVAIDEAQDFDLIRIKLIYGLRKSDASKFYIVYDEAQKINRTTFNADELDVSLPKFTGHGIVFDTNHRNHEDIIAFANHMKDNNAPLPTGSETVRVKLETFDRIVANIATLPLQDESVAILLSTNADIDDWASELDAQRLPYRKLNDGDNVTNPGLYLSSLWTIKGLEFDRVIIPQMNEDKSYYYHRAERDNLYFVAFTRARKSLEIYYQDTPHAVLEERYGALLRETTVSSQRL
jgi:superfamily I DNA/RNA helicase